MSDPAQPDPNVPPDVDAPAGAPVVEPVPPTQVRHPWRATVRTTFAAFVALCALLPVMLGEIGVDPDQVPWLALPLAVAALVTRIMASPAVEGFLRQYVRFLAARPPTPPGA